MTSQYYVYVLMDSSKPGKFIYGDFTLNFEPFYIGKGVSNRINETLHDKSPFKRNKIKKLKLNNIKILNLKLIENLSNLEALEHEIKLISIIGRRDLKNGPLVNMTDGGDGRLNSHHSEETKKKISINRTGVSIGWKHSTKTLLEMSKNQTGSNNGFYGKTHSSYNKEMQSKRVSGIDHPMYGKKHNKETINKLVINRKNISNSRIKESCQIFNKSVLMYDLELNFIEEFESVKLASKKTKIGESIISKCCRGDIKKPTRFYINRQKKHISL